MKGTVRDRQKQGEELGDLPTLPAKGDQGVSDEETLAVPAAHEHLHRLRPPCGIGDHGGAAVVLDDAPVTKEQPIGRSPHFFSRTSLLE